jgi:hypothetical protein
MRSITTDDRPVIAQLEYAEGYRSDWWHTPSHLALLRHDGALIHRSRRRGARHRCSGTLLQKCTPVQLARPSIYQWQKYF